MIAARNDEDNYRLYVNGAISYFPTMDAAKQAAVSFMRYRPGFRIEILLDIEPGEADFWAFNYEKKNNGSHREKSAVRKSAIEFF